MTLDPESPESLFDRLVGYWEVIARNTDISAEQVARQALIAPAKCCIKNAIMADMGDESVRVAPNCSDPQTEEDLVERAFSYLPGISGMLREKFNL